MEQALIDEGLPDTEVKRLCDVHMAVFQEGLAAIPAPIVPSGHPVDTFQRENRAVLELTQDAPRLGGRVGAGAQPAAWEQEKAVMGPCATSLAGFELHYVRKENQLFPFLEKHGVEGLTKVMWALHDDIRLSIKELRGAIAQQRPGRRGARRRRGGRPWWRTW